METEKSGIKRKIGKLCSFYIYEGLCEGLSHFSGPSRAAVIFAVRPEDHMRIYDPQNLLDGHEPKLKELFLDSNEWRELDQGGSPMFGLTQPVTEKSLQLDGLISRGARSRNIFYQMWFTEHHPDMCSVGPTERWLEHAAWLLSHDVTAEHTSYLNTSGYVLRGYATHAVRDFIVDELNLHLGMDVQMRIYPVLDSILGISKTVEEGAAPRGQIVFIEKPRIKNIYFLIRFPKYERPSLENFKHVRKLLLAVENSDRKLISDGKSILGVAGGKLPKYHLTADFRGGHGFVCINDDPICSFYDGSFHSSTRKAKLVELEEILLEYNRAPSHKTHLLYKTVMELIHHAEESKHGCTIVIDLNSPTLRLSGQRLEYPLDLSRPRFLELTKSLSKVDGALHVSKDIRLHAFACILDGVSIANEDRARGARFNSALRFTAHHPNIVVVVVSSDRPVSLIQEGVELTAHCYWRPISAYSLSPPTLEQWVSRYSEDN